MFNHPTGLFSGDYNSALKGCWPLKFLHTLQLPKMYFKSYLGRRAASCWALPHISSVYFYIVFVLQIAIVLVFVHTERSAIVLVHVFVFVTKIALLSSIVSMLCLTLKTGDLQYIPFFNMRNLSDVILKVH